jgi:hypothetical protein
MPFSVSLFCLFILHGQTIVFVFHLTLLTNFEFQLVFKNYISNVIPSCFSHTVYQKFHFLRLDFCFCLSCYLFISKSTHCLRILMRMCFRYVFIITRPQKSHGWALPTSPSMLRFSLQHTSLYRLPSLLVIFLTRIFIMIIM